MLALEDMTTMDDRVNSIHLLEKVLAFQEIDDDDDDDDAGRVPYRSVLVINSTWIYPTSITLIQLE
jgi:hypothetical protein